MDIWKHVIRRLSVLSFALVILSTQAIASTAWAATGESDDSTANACQISNVRNNVHPGLDVGGLRQYAVGGLADTSGCVTAAMHVVGIPQAGQGTPSTCYLVFPQEPGSPNGTFCTTLLGFGANTGVALPGATISLRSEVIGVGSGGDVRRTTKTCTVTLGNFGSTC